MEESFQSSTNDNTNVCVQLELNSEILSNLSLTRSNGADGGTHLSCPLPWEDSNTTSDPGPKIKSVSSACDDILQPELKTVSWSDFGEILNSNAEQQVNKISSMHLEAEYSLHHQEPDYAHHRHYSPQHYHHHHHQAFSFLTVGPKEGHLTTRLIPQQSSNHYSCEESAEFDSRDSTDEPHFRDDYPHHHHHHHHHHHYHHVHHHHHGAQLKIEQPVLPLASILTADEQLSLVCKGTRTVPDSLTRQRYGKMGEAEFPSRMECSGEPQDAWHKLKLRVMAWLDNVQDDLLCAMDESPEKIPEQCLAADHIDFQMQ